MRHSYPTTILAVDLKPLFGPDAASAYVVLLPAPDDATIVRTVYGQLVFQTFSKRRQSYQHRFVGRLFYELKAAVFAGTDARGGLPFIYFHRWGWTLLRARNASGAAQALDPSNPRWS